MVDQSCYVAGPVSDIENGNRDEFILATVTLRAEGWDVYSPHEHPNSAACLAESVRLGPTKRREGPIYQSLMRDFFMEILRRRQIFVLDGWECAPGAWFEIALGQWTGKPVVGFRVNPKERFPVNASIAILLNGWHTRPEIAAGMDPMAVDPLGTPPKTEWPYVPPWML